MCVSRLICCMFPCVQNDRYTVGGSEMFDTLTDLVEFYKRKGIEEISGNWVYLKQVNWAFFPHPYDVDKIICSIYFWKWMSVGWEKQKHVFVNYFKRWAAQPTDRKYYSQLCLNMASLMMTMLCVAFIGSSFISIIRFFLSVCPLQPYYSTRVNAADIDSRVKQLDQTSQQQQEGDGEKSKAGFWEEFDVRFDPVHCDWFLPWCFYLWCKSHRVVLKWGKVNYTSDWLSISL